MYGGSGSEAAAAAWAPELPDKCMEGPSRSVGQSAISLVNVALTV